MDTAYDAGNPSPALKAAQNVVQHHIYLAIAVLKNKFLNRMETSF